MDQDSRSQLLERDQPGTFSLGPAQRWIWSQDGSHLFGHDGSGIIERPVSAPGEVRRLAEASGINFLEDVSPDGKLALYSSSARSVFSVRLDSAQVPRPTPVVQTGEQIMNTRFSPDGRWIVYDAGTAQNARLGIYAQPFPGPGLRRQISSSGFFPVWRKDGKEIIYIDRKSNQISSISVSGPDGDLRFGSPTPLFAAPPSFGLVVGSNALAVTRDGSQILFPVALPRPEDSNVIHIKSAALAP